MLFFLRPSSSMPYSHLTLLFKDLFPAKHFTMLLFKIIRGLFRKKLTHLVVIVDICESENPNQKKKNKPFYHFFHLACWTPILCLSYLLSYLVSFFHMWVIKLLQQVIKLFGGLWVGRGLKEEHLISTICVFSLWPL